MSEALRQLGVEEAQGIEERLVNSVAEARHPIRLAFLRVMRNLLEYEADFVEALRVVSQDNDDPETDGYLSVRGRALRADLEQVRASFESLTSREAHAEVGRSVRATSQELAAAEEAAYTIDGEVV